MAKKETAATLAAKAKQIAEAHRASVVYANSIGEFFTNKNFALTSEGGDKTKVQTFDFSNAAEVVDEGEGDGAGKE